MNVKENVKEKLIKLLQECVDENIETDDPFDGFWVLYGNIADYLIANGVTIPVRCKECDYHLHGGCAIEWEIRQDSENWFEQFCSDGKRKE